MLVYNCLTKQIQTTSTTHTTTTKKKTSFQEKSYAMLFPPPRRPVGRILWNPLDISGHTMVHEVLVSEIKYNIL